MPAADHTNPSPPREWTADSWLRSLQLSAVIADALRLGDADAFDQACKLQKGVLEARLAEARLSGLTDPIWAGLCSLRNQCASTGRALDARFREDKVQPLAYGSLDKYFGGLERLLGPPRMYEGCLRKQMSREHCNEADSD
eukprot:7134691-Prymnesium_polylepis.1